MKIYLIILLIISSVYVNAQKIIHQEVTNTKIEVTDTKIVFSITKNGKPFKGTTFNVGDSLTVTAKLKDGTIATGGRWKYENNNIKINNISKNPLDVKLKKPGTCKITYLMNGKVKATVNLIIKKHAFKKTK